MECVSERTNERSIDSQLAEMRSSGLLAAAIPRVSFRRIAQPGLIPLANVSAYAQKVSHGANNSLRQHYSSIPNASLQSRIAQQPNILKPFTTSNHGPLSSIARPGCLRKVRFLSATIVRRNVSNRGPSNNPENARMELEEREKAALEEIHRGFERTEKASQAAKIDLSARLAKDSGGKKAGFGEVWRLLKIARPEAKVLSIAFLCLLISSSITMSIPFSIGKILDIATHGSPEGGNELFGLTLPVFYGVLGGVLALGAAANYGRIIILRIVGERIVARLRSKLFRRTFIQDAEFFDANRVGDLISRLSSDTIIVGKSITQNLSDGLRAFVSGAAGFGLMAFVSLKLSSVLLVLLPPLALGAFFYGRAIRNISRKIQKNLGGLTKIAEERLGNVKTSQAFAGEILEVNRYNKQVRKIFDLGKKESFVSATFFSSVTISSRSSS